MIQVISRRRSSISWITRRLNVNAYGPDGASSSDASYASSSIWHASIYTIRKYKYHLSIRLGLHIFREEIEMGGDHTIRQEAQMVEFLVSTLTLMGSYMVEEEHDGKMEHMKLPLIGIS